MTVTLDASGLKPGDVAGLALFNRPYAWIGVERSDDGLTLAQLDEVTGKTSRAPLPITRVWLRADCDFVKNAASFHYSTDGATYAALGERHVMAYGLITFQGVRNSPFSYSTRSDAEGGHADFDAIQVTEGPRPAIPYGRRLELAAPGRTSPLAFDETVAFNVVDRGLGRVALEADGGHLSVGQDRVVSHRRGTAGEAVDGNVRRRPRPDVAGDEAVPAPRPRGPGAGRQPGTSPGWPGRCSLPVAGQVSRSV